MSWAVGRLGVGGDDGGVESAEGGVEGLQGADGMDGWTFERELFIVGRGRDGVPQVPWRMNQELGWIGERETGWMV
jgi:hypothetical protein